MLEKLSAVHEGEHKVELFWGLEGELEVHDERVLDLSQDIPLGDGVLDLIPFDNVCLGNRKVGKGG